MKNLKITQKLLIGIVGQAILICLLLLFIFSFNNKLDSITLQKTENIKEVNMIRRLSNSVMDFIYNKKTLSELKNEFSKIEQYVKNASYNDEIQNFRVKINKIQQLKNKNLQLETQVMNSTDEAIKQVTLFVESVSTRLNDISKRESVSIQEIQVLKTAHACSNEMHAVRNLFEKIKEDFSNKDKLLECFDNLNEGTKKDIETLKNTELAALPVNALKANANIKKDVLQFIENFENINKISEDITTSTELFITELNNGDLNSIKDSFSALKITIRNVFITLLIIAFIIIIINFSLVRLLNFVFKGLTADLYSISNGNLNIKVPEGFDKRKDEIGILSRSFVSLVDNLKRITSSIMTGSDNVASASQQISSSTQQLSQGTSEQASSAEEVSSSMEEMTSNIQQNTDNAQQTEKISVSAASGVSKVVTASQESLSSIKQIADKIIIVNEIAFQTNILSLNAAVEAARAGEHGKGFAVVAAEVRKLAERSKTAADEIVSLSNNSLKVTEDSSKLLIEIMPEIERTAKLVQEISVASLEQNTGADQVNSAIQQLNQITQQNAAASEEMATSLEELSGQADQLREIIGFFKIDENATINNSNNALQQFNPAKNKLGKPVGSNGGTNKKEIENKGFDLKLVESDKLDLEFESY